MTTKSRETILLLKSQNKDQEAFDKFQHIKNTTLLQFFDLFKKVIDSFSATPTSEIAVIIEYNGSNFAMLADEIKKMVHFKPESMQKGSLTDSPFIRGVFDNEDGLFQELDLKGILCGKDLETFVETSDETNSPKTVNLKELVKQDF